MEDILGKKVKGGIIVSIIDADFYCSALKAFDINVDYKIWDQEYPGWRKKPILHVFYKKPQKSLTFDQWLSYHLEEPIESVREQYDALPEYYQLAMPFDVLFKKEDENE